MKTALFAYFITGLLLVATIGVLLCIVLPHLFRKQFDRAYSRKRDFPFELLFAKNQYLPLGRFMVVLGAVVGFISSGMFLSSVTLYPNFLDMAIFVVVFGAISSACFALTWLIRADIHVKSHLFSFLLFGFTSSLLDFANLLAYAHFPSLNVGVRALLVSLTAILALAKVILLVNPKLKDWAKMESRMEQDGTVVTCRPKIFIMAFSEWCIVIAHFLSLILMLASYFVLILPLL